MMDASFMQPDALAVGKQGEELEKENVAPQLMQHKSFPGNRPSSRFLF
jgi:glucose-6-phosphate isomerase